MQDIDKNATRQETYEEPSFANDTANNADHVSAAPASVFSFSIGGGGNQLQDAEEIVDNDQ